MRSEAFLLRERNRRLISFSVTQKRGGFCREELEIIFTRFSGVCRLRGLAAAQVLISVHVSPILGSLTIVVLGAVALRIRPEGFARG